jgi:hypothetical protein
MFLLVLLPKFSYLEEVIVRLLFFKQIQGEIDHFGVGY